MNHIYEKKKVIVRKFKNTNLSDIFDFALKTNIS